MGLLEKIKKPNAKAFTHSGKFHADDVFSSALLLYLNPQITITRGNRVPEEYDGIVFDIGRGRYDHHQRDSRVRENGVPYAAFGLLWEELGGEILGGTLAQRFDEEFVQPLDNNDNTGEKNELATLIGNFNPVWDAQKNIQKEEECISAEPALTAEEKSRGLTKEFQRAVQMAGMILENKFARYRADARADAQIEVVLSAREDPTDTRILVLSEFVPCQKRLKETDTAFVIFPSNRGGYCIQPQKKPDSMNYKCSFPKQWLGLENEELQKATGLASAGFCHKGGFLMTVGDEADAIRACEISLEEYEQKPVIVCLWDAGEAQETKKLRERRNGAYAQADSGYDRCTDLSHDTSASSGSGRTGHVCGSCDGKRRLEKVYQRVCKNKYSNVNRKRFMLRQICLQLIRWCMHSAKNTCRY